MNRYVPHIHNVEMLERLDEMFVSIMCGAVT